ncbi:hypothetical protein Glove_23g119 [Diversispora epigaea]|uniref:Uncharacterized protein n=1 Tax=Diversispora epigaea TaxID=1348612 RepID=A0A397JL94_9GLOM|nr:hypothetical protein Glove_23g117 [Diversispora epigaea]RHZ88387.1 hypothetical protein Glove_23g119 [Diversispora epigaea]
MPKHRSITVSLVNIGRLIEDLHYGSYSRFWWKLNNKENNIYFPLRIGQKTKTCLNNYNFFVTIVAGNKDDAMLPGYLCQCNNYIGQIENDPSKAISLVYVQIFRNKTRFSGPLVLGWQDNNIVQQLSSDIPFAPIEILIDSLKIFIYGIGASSYENWRNADNQIKKRFEGETPNNVWKNSGQIKKYDGNQLFGLENSLIQNILQHKIPTCTSKEWDNIVIIELLYKYHLKRCTIANINWHQFFLDWLNQDNPIIELYSQLQDIYPKNYEFSDPILRAAGSYNITPWVNTESKYQFWTKSSQPTYERTMLKQLNQMGFLVSTPIHMPNSTRTFWNCFKRALDNNKKNCDGKRRILSIIADKFTYVELRSNLNVGDHTIFESRKYAQINGYGAPSLMKLIISHVKLKEESLKQFELFFTDKKNVNMSSYKTDNKTGLLVLYLQDHKQALWKKFRELYPDGMRRSSFMARLDGDRFQYKKDLGGLCMTCNECGYLVFAEIEKIIDTNIINPNIRKELINESQILKRYLRRDFSNTGRNMEYRVPD